MRKKSYIVLLLIIIFSTMVLAHDISTYRCLHTDLLDFHENAFIAAFSKKIVNGLYKKHLVQNTNNQLYQFITYEYNAYNNSMSKYETAQFEYDESGRILKILRFNKNDIKNNEIHYKRSDDVTLTVSTIHYGYMDPDTILDTVVENSVQKIYPSIESFYGAEAADELCAQSGLKSHLDSIITIDSGFKYVNGYADKDSASIYVLKEIINVDESGNESIFLDSLFDCSNSKRQLIVDQYYKNILIEGNDEHNDTVVMYKKSNDSWEPYKRQLYSKDDNMRCYKKILEVWDNDTWKGDKFYKKSFSFDGLTDTLQQGIPDKDNLEPLYVTVFFYNAITFIETDNTLLQNKKVPDVHVLNGKVTLSKLVPGDKVNSIIIFNLNGKILKRINNNDVYPEGSSMVFHLNNNTNSVSLGKVTFQSNTTLQFKINQCRH